jgi:hypothetical protein
VVAISSGRGNVSRDWGSVLILLALLAMRVRMLVLMMIMHLLLLLLLLLMHLLMLLNRLRLRLSINLLLLIMKGRELLICHQKRVDWVEIVCRVVLHYCKLLGGR